MLYIIEKAGGAMPRRELHRALGVAGSTVSRMLLSLENLGLLLREIMLDDHRRKMSNPACTSPKVMSR